MPKLDLAIYIDGVGASDLIKTLERRYQTFYASRSPTSFGVQWFDQPIRVIGQGEPRYTFTVIDHRGAKALASLDQLSVADAYLEGWLELEGDLIAALSMRKFFHNFHPVLWLRRYAIMNLHGRRKHDANSISDHYDIDSDFFLTFLDRRHRCYTQGIFRSDTEPLEDAVTRKMEVAIQAVGATAGDHVLDVGGGWGAFMQFAARRNIRVTSLTLSAESERYMRNLVQREELDATVVRQHFLDHTSKNRYDAIVNMGATEHLSDYCATLRKYAQLLRPGGKIYLDALAMRKKHRVSAFMSRHIYPGTSSPLILHGYLAQVARSPFLLASVHDERHDYYLTCREWAQRLDNARQDVVERWGERMYRRFRLFLWGSAASFAIGQVQAYRWVLELPAMARVSLGVDGVPA